MGQNIAIADSFEDLMDPRAEAEIHDRLGALDQQLIDLLSQRFALVRAGASRFCADDVPDDTVHRELLLTARRMAFERNVPVGLVADLWDRMADASVAFERQTVDRLRAANR